MKNLIFTYSILLLTAIAHGQNYCGGTCVGTSNNQYLNAACQAASANGQRACENYSGLGCQWQARNVVPGRCIGTGNNSYYDSACQAATVNGQRACEAYSGIGCTWVAPFCN